MSVAPQLESVLGAGGPALAQGLELTEQRLREIVASEGETLGAPAAQTLAAGGKRLRPMLVFLCGGDSSQRLVNGAAAVELLHMATLVHDDVLDRAALRRGRPTVFATDGRATATATGDLLFSRAFAQLAAAGSEHAVKVLSAASSALARGELMQRDDAFDVTVTPERYRARCEHKTASLFAAACRLGVELGGAGGEQKLGAFGRDIGLAFQILDDVLDVSGPASRTGKARGTDLLDGTVTLPLILARQQGPELAEIDLRSLDGNAERAEQLCEQIAATDALDRARDEALGYVAQAKAGLVELDLPPQRLRALELVADGVVARYA